MIRIKERVQSRNYYESANILILPQLRNKQVSRTRFTLPLYLRISFIS